jgi:outer membrane protein
MKRLILIFIFSVFWVFTAYGEEIKIGYVDLNKALNESEAGKRATKILEDMVNNKKSILSQKEKELKSLDEEIKKQSSILTPESIKSKTEEFNRLYKDYQRLVKDFQEEIQKKEAEFTRQIQNDLLEIIRKIGEEESYTIILEVNASGVLYAKKKIDLTEKLIKKYNEISKAKSSKK